jgi:hypothetical protein
MLKRVIRFTVEGLCCFEVIRWQIAELLSFIYKHKKNVFTNSVVRQLQDDILRQFEIPDLFLRNKQRHEELISFLKSVDIFVGDARLYTEMIKYLYIHKQKYTLDKKDKLLKFLQDMLLLHIQNNNDKAPKKLIKQFVTNVHLQRQNDQHGFESQHPDNKWLNFYVEKDVSQTEVNKIMPMYKYIHENNIRQLGCFVGTEKLLKLLIEKNYKFDDIELETLYGLMYSYSNWLPQALTVEHYTKIKKTEAEHLYSICASSNAEFAVYCLILSENNLKFLNDGTYYPIAPKKGKNKDDNKTGEYLKYKTDYYSNMKKIAKKLEKHIPSNKYATFIEKMNDAIEK